MLCVSWHAGKEKGITSCCIKECKLPVEVLRRISPHPYFLLVLYISINPNNRGGSQSAHYIHCEINGLASASRAHLHFIEILWPLRGGRKGNVLQQP